MKALAAVMYREGKIRATNVTFIFWDLVYPLAYLLVFGVGMTAMGFSAPGIGVDYNAFFLAGVLGMASFGIASNTSWSFFMDRDNGIFYEMLTYPMTRAQYLLGKTLFNLLIALGQAAITVALSNALLGVPIRWQSLPLLGAAVFVGTAGWFFFYAIFALVIRRNDAFNTVTSVLYFVLLFASSMFYPHRAAARRVPAGCAGQSDHLARGRDAVRHHRRRRRPWSIAVESAAFTVFTAAAFGSALWALSREP